MNVNKNKYQFSLTGEQLEATLKTSATNKVSEKNKVTADKKSNGSHKSQVEIKAFTV
jgi:hypothetical protein